MTSRIFGHALACGEIAVLFISLMFSVQAAPRPIVAIVDSGIDDTHSALAGRVVAGYDFTGGKGPFVDRVGHGTAMASIVAADGAAPGRWAYEFWSALAAANGGTFTHVEL